jgi:hypothetical protein
MARPVSGVSQPPRRGPSLQSGSGSSRRTRRGDRPAWAGLPRPGASGAEMLLVSVIVLLEHRRDGNCPSARPGLLPRSYIRVLPFGLGGRRTVEVECGLADAGSYDDDVGWLCGGVALTVHSAFRHVYEVARTRLHRVRAVRTKFHLECTGEDVDHRFVFAVMMPAGHHSRLGTHESRPRSVGSEGLLSIHPWRRRAGLTLYRPHKQNQILLVSHERSLLPRPRPMTLPGGGTPCPPATMVSLSGPWWCSPFLSGPWWCSPYKQSRLNEVIGDRWTLPQVQLSTCHGVITTTASRSVYEIDH